MSDYQSLFRVIDLKLEIVPSLPYCRRNACSTAAGCTMMCVGA